MVVDVAFGLGMKLLDILLLKKWYRRSQRELRVN